MKAGFTLVEVLVALVLAGLGVSVAGGVFGAANDTIARLARASHRWTRLANARVWLDETLMSAEVEAGAGVTFEGDPQGIRFRGWQWTRDGWVEPASIEISFKEEGLFATSDIGWDALLLDARGGGEIQYLPRPGSEVAWQGTWNSDGVLPAAVRIITRSGTVSRSASADTFLVLVGAGG